jgi:hypothetical protein
MTKVTIDETLRSKLHNFTEAVELCDESGRVVAQVFPVEDLSQYDCTEPPISEEELERRRNSTESYTTAEVLAYLENLEKR